MHHKLPLLKPARLPLDIEVGDSIGLLGMRHTGKTTLGKDIYRAAMDSDDNMVGYIIDSNRGGDFTGWSGAYFGNDPPIIGPSEKGRQLVWQPQFDGFTMYEDFFGNLFERMQGLDFPVFLLIDELSALKGGDDHPEFERLLKRARKRPNFPGITTMYFSQALAQKAKVPRAAFTQVVHFGKFTVQHPYDLAEANRMMGLPLRVQPPHEHGFWWARMDKPPIRAHYYKGKELVIRR